MIPERTKKHRRKVYFLVIACLACSIHHTFCFYNELILGVYTQVTGYRLIQRRIIVTDEDMLSCQCRRRLLKSCE
ncbi:unnamed protein product [Brassica rapa subsp. trilocularis]